MTVADDANMSLKPDINEAFRRRCSIQTGLADDVRGAIIDQELMTQTQLTHSLTQSCRRAIRMLFRTHSMLFGHFYA